MGLFSWLQDQIGREAQHRARVQIPDDRNLTGADTAVGVVAERHYVRLWISELFLEKDRIWFETRFPLVYSVIGLSYAGRSQEFANISGKNRFDIQQPDLGRSILRNYPLTPLLPFHGGTIELDCGLVSMPADNVLQSFAGVVSDIAGKLNQPMISSALGVATSIASGVQSVLGAGKATTELYFHETFDAGTLKPGYIYLSSKARDEVEARRIWITQDGIRTGATAGTLGGLDPQDYLVLRLQIADSRDDWRSMPAIETPLNGAIEALLVGETEKAGLLLTQAKQAALANADLTRLDKVRILKGIDAEFQNPDASLEAAFSPTLGTKGPAPTTLERAASRISTKLAAEDPAFSDTALLEAYAATVP